jgi:hypothetical protein
MSLACVDVVDVGGTAAGGSVVDVGGAAGGSAVVGGSAGWRGATVDGLAGARMCRCGLVVEPSGGIVGVGILPPESAVSVPANVPSCCGCAAPSVLIAKLVVVSASVPVTATVCVGGAVSPGAPTVVEALPAVPSCTTSYCCCSRCMLLARRQPGPTAANNKSKTTPVFELMTTCLGSRMLCAMKCARCGLFVLLTPAVDG